MKTRRAPSRHRRDTRVYGLTTTAMHGMSTPPSRTGSAPTRSKQARIARCQSPPHKRFVVGCCSHPSCHSPNTSQRFALGASNVCLVGENRRAPSRYCTGARVYGHTPTAMHDNKYPSPPPRNAIGSFPVPPITFGVASSPLIECSHLKAAFGRAVVSSFFRFCFERHVGGGRGGRNKGEGGGEWLTP